MPNVTTTFNYVSCPTGDVQTALLFAFLGIFLFALLVISMKLLKIPFFTIMAGIAFIFFGVISMGCHHIIGFSIVILGMGAITYEILTHK
jgi:hypothetical protein